MTVPGDIRALPRSLASIVTELELTQPKIVTLKEIEIIADEAGVATHAFILASRLKNLGWLLPTGIRGTYEFAPGAHAGPYGHGDPFLALHALLRLSPKFPGVVALQSALWTYGMSDRTPNIHEIAVPPGIKTPAALSREVRVVRFKPALPVQSETQTPVYQPASLLVHLATKPADVRNWTVFEHPLEDLVQQSTVEDLEAELAEQSHATRIRLAYLISGVDPDLSKELLPEPAGGVTRFGPRTEPLRYASYFNIVDTALPFDPRTL